MADNPTTNGADPAAFIARWSKAEGSERSNYGMFLTELCDLIGVARPDPAGKDTSQNAYVFERSVEVSNRDGTTSTNFLDLYKRGAFVLEAKQGVEKQDAEDPIARKRKLKKGHGVRGSKGWDTTMTRAKAQAERYAHALPTDEPSPPFLMVADVGHVIEVYSDFSQMGRQYLPFPDPGSFRIQLKDLAEESARERLRKIWEDPWSLDPTRHSARVTREVADRLAKLAKSFEKDGHSPQRVAEFLMRCLFTMFAEDVGLIPENGFTRLLEEQRDDLAHLPQMLTHLWQTMNKGGFSPILKADLLRFNGGLYLHQEALPLTRDQLDLLIEAARADWKDVEPAIFGTLLERALDPIERHKLGAHYTPRAYVERLVMPTIIEPLRADWDGVKTAAIRYLEEGDSKKAAEAVRAYHRKLCSTRVLDPACGSGNFLYVTLEHMKRLEGEVDDFLHNELGEQAGLGLWGTAHQRTGRGEKLKKGEHFTVDPHQFLGIEVNPRAATIAEMVLWIGYLQWHYRAFGIENLPEPVLRDFHNVECRDAVLAWDSMEEETGEDGKPLTRWDGRTYKKHPVTGEDVPDETARVQVYRYINPRKAQWPEADFVVGNPPFVGNFKMRDALGSGYVDTLRRAYDSVPETSDYVMYWWDKAAELTRAGMLRRFGLIATNSLRQTFNRKVLQRHMTANNPVSLLFAIPDHPWVDASDGAAVRISMTSAGAGDALGRLGRITSETPRASDGVDVTIDWHSGRIFADLTIGADIGSCSQLQANDNLSCPGVKLHGAGFILTAEEAASLGYTPESSLAEVIKPYRNGRDITQTTRDVYVIDLFGLTADAVRETYPSVYQRVLERVKPERDQNNRATYRDNWWLFGEPRANFRPALKGLPRYIATTETAKHRFFVFLDGDILPDNMLVNIALDDAFYLGVLSSRIHVTWALAAGGTLEDRPRYNKTLCFDPFPFPDPPGAIKQRIRALGEQLDAHRKARQAEHPELTMTGMYNVLEKLRAGEKLTAKEKAIHEQGLVSVLKQIHDDLDAAVFEAYGWSADLSDEEILEKLVALNHERAEEEAGGLIRWLRPEFQNPSGKQGAAQGELVKEKKKKAAAAPKEKQDWPAALPEQAQAIAGVLATAEAPLDAGALAKHFKRGNKKRVEELLATLAEMGRAREVGEGRYVA